MAFQQIFIESLNNICGSKAGLVAASFAPQMEAADGQGSGYETLKELAVWLLVESNVLNQLHWNTDKNLKHELLNEAYELCRDTGDKLAETYIALTGKPCDKEFPKVSSGASLKDSDTLAVLKKINEHMNDACAKNDKFSEGVKNIFADFDESMTTIIYKYTQFSA